MDHSITVDESTAPDGGIAWQAFCTDDCKWAGRRRYASDYDGTTDPADAAYGAAAEEGRAHEDNERGQAMDTQVREAAKALFDKWVADLVWRAHLYAEENNLCSQFDDAMDSLGLPARQRSYEVRLSGTWSGQVTVRATSEYEAERIAASMDKAAMVDALHTEYDEHPQGAVSCIVDEWTLGEASLSDD